MDALLQSRAEELVQEFAGQATTVEELNELMRLMLKKGLERMLDTEMDVHLGRFATACLRPAVARGVEPSRLSRLMRLVICWYRGGVGCGRWT